jgi:hypothetical protein
MKKALLAVLLLAGCVTQKKHHHKESFKDKCNFPGCGWYCECGAKFEYGTGKVLKMSPEMEKKSLHVIRTIIDTTRKQ